MEIQINDKKYNVSEARTEFLKQKGLQNVEKLDSDEGMLFYYDPPEDVSFWMKNVKIPLDIIFINDELEVIQVSKGEPESEELIFCKNVAFVLEVNLNSGIQKGDDLELESNQPIMKVLAPDGSDQYELWGGERIFSRKNTRILLKKARKADETKDDKDYKSLGKYIFKCIKIQDERDPEYVLTPS